MSHDGSECAKGAEAVITETEYLGRDAVVKYRPPKTYRLPELDAHIRSSRTRNEARIMHEARDAGVRTPCVYDIDLKQCSITMERIRGEMVKDHLDTHPEDAERVCRMVGECIAKLHTARICHGDLTTSNMTREGLHIRTYRPYAGLRRNDGDILLDRPRAQGDHEEGRGHQEQREIHMKLKVITSNPGKVAEYQKELSGYGIEMEHVRLPYDEVQTSDLEEVVNKGMDAIIAKGVRDFIIDDSGLFVDALKGFPGVWSAYAQKTIGNPGILRLMEGVADRGAEFRCCIGCDVNGERIVVTGRCRGVITESEQGDGGFGFDPVFSHDGVRTFAEIPMDEKNSVSHRGNAVRLLIDALKSKGLI